ncbi:MAG: site-2 protease family protein [Acidobacteriota bacterium]
MESQQITSFQGATVGTIPFLRIAGVPVRFHFTFLLLLGYVAITGLSHSSGSTFALYVLGLFASVLLHELAHASAARACGVSTLEIVMFPIGGLSRLERRLYPGEELLVALAGPAANFAISGGLFGYMLAKHLPVDIDITALLTPSADNVIERLAFANLLLAGFNLIPAFPMDGGRVLRALLSYLKPEDQATSMAAWMGRMVAISMGLYGLIFSQFPLVFSAFFIWLGAAQESAAAVGRSVTQGIPVRATMVTEFHCLPHGATAREATELLLGTEQQEFPVMHGDQVVGLLNRKGVLKAMAGGGPEAYVASTMSRDFLSVGPDADLSEVLPLMARAGRCGVVVEEGRLIGLLPKDNLSEFLLLRRVGLEMQETAGVRSQESEVRISGD